MPPSSFFSGALIGIMPLLLTGFIWVRKLASGILWWSLHVRRWELLCLSDLMAVRRKHAHEWIKFDAKLCGQSFQWNRKVSDATSTQALCRAKLLTINFLIYKHVCGHRVGFNKWTFLEQWVFFNLHSISVSILIFSPFWRSLQVKMGIKSSILPRLSFWAFLSLWMWLLEEKPKWDVAGKPELKKTCNK